MNKIFSLLCFLMVMCGTPAGHAQSIVENFNAYTTLHASDLNTMQQSLVAVNNGASKNQQLSSPVLTGASSTGETLVGASLDATSKVNGTSITDPSWLGFITKPTTWTVCASGCAYPDPLTAWNAAQSLLFLNGATLTISIADGTYNIANQIFTNSRIGQNIQIIGDQTDPSKVVINFTNIKGNDLNGFTAVDGGVIRLVDGMTINGVGAIESENTTSTQWYDNSFGSAFLARGAGSFIGIGPKVVANHMYYAALADEGATIDAPNGMTATDAGDVGFLARHNGVLRCLGCTMTRAADNGGDLGNNLGCNYMAESGGTLIIYGSSGSGGNIGAVCGITNGHGWAQNFTASGGLGGKNGNGAWAISGASIQIQNSTFSGYNNGVYAGSHSILIVDGTTASNNAADGFVADGGLINGTGATAKNNGQYGAAAFHQGTVQLFSSISTFTGNTGGNGNVEAAGTSNGYAYNASSLLLN